MEVEQNLMLTEYEVRTRMESIRSSRIAPLRKARLLLKLGKSLRTQAETLAATQHVTDRSDDLRGTAALLRIAKRSRALNEDVRDAAIQALSTG